MKDTILGRAANTRRFYNAELNNCWIVLGGSTPWPTEPTPPEEDVTLVEVPELAVAKLASLQLVVPDPLGTIVYYDNNNQERKYREIAVGDIVAEDCTRILFSTTLLGSEVDSSTGLRVLGVAVGVQGSVGGGLLAPEEVTDPGELCAVEYRRPLYLNGSSSYAINIMLEF